MSDEIKITVEERSHPHLRKLARALISLANRQADEQRATDVDQLIDDEAARGDAA